MKVHLIRHGMTRANKERIYCGRTDLPLTAEGVSMILSLKKEISYPAGDTYFTSGLLRTSQTLDLIYGKKSFTAVPEISEIDFGLFEMRSYEELKDDILYQQWIADTDNNRCPRGESGNDFKKRAVLGFKKILSICADRGAETAVIVTHGGVIAKIMDLHRPGKKTFYEWLPALGRGYTVDLDAGVCKSYAAI